MKVIRKETNSEDVYSFNPTKFFKGEDMQAEAYIEVDITDDEGHKLDTMLMPAKLYETLTPEEFQQETLKAYKTFLMARKLIDPEAVKALAEDFKKSVDIADLVGGMVWLHILNVYQKLVKRGPTVDEQKLDTAEEAFIKQLRPVLNTDEAYQNMAKQAWTEAIALALQDIQADLGEGFISTASDEEFNKAMEEHLYAEDFDLNTVLNNSVLHFVQDLAKQVVEALDLPHKSISSIERLLGLQRETVQLKPSTLNSDIEIQIKEAFLPVPTNIEIQLGFKAIWGGGKNWRDKGIWGIDPYDGVARVMEPVGGHSSVLIWVDPKIEYEESSFTSEDMAAYIESLSPLTTDVALAVLAALGESEDPFNKAVKITVDDIIKLKGIKAWGLQKEELIKRIDQEMKNLQRLRFEIHSMPSPDPNTGKWVPEGHSWENDRLFDIVRVEKYKQSPIGEKKTIAVAWSVRAGQWAQYFLTPNGLRQVCYVSKKLLELSHRDDRKAEQLAKKIGQYVSLLKWRLGLGQDLTFKIGNLCHAIGELPEQEQNPGRFRDSFETALNLLTENGIFERIDYGPDKFNDYERTKGWLSRWLNYTITFILPTDEAPEEPQADLPQLPEAPNTEPKRQRKSRKARRKPKKEDPFDGTVLRSARQQKNITQEELAQYLGITRKQLSLIENNKVKPSAGTLKKIRKWLSYAE